MKGDLMVMADQVRRGVAWVYRNAKSFGGDPDRLYVSGHSSGAHLAGVVLTTEWQRDHGSVKAAGKMADLVVLNGYNHFEVAESLGNPYGLLGRSVLRQMKLSSI